MSDVWHWPVLKLKMATVAAENYYEHAEHFYRLMFTDLNHKWEL